MAFNSTEYKWQLRSRTAHFSVLTADDDYAEALPDAMNRRGKELCFPDKRTSSSAHSAIPNSDPVHENVRHFQTPTAAVSAPSAQECQQPLHDPNSEHYRGLHGYL